MVCRGAYDEPFLIQQGRRIPSLFQHPLDPAGVTFCKRRMVWLAFCAESQPGNNRESITLHLNFLKMKLASANRPSFTMHSEESSSLISDNLEYLLLSSFGIHSLIGCHV